MKITILCENTVGKLIGSGEHGFSAFIETEEGNFLFDTGSGHSNEMGTPPWERLIHQDETHHIRNGLPFYPIP